ncbi:MAG: peptidylprolyl isomerase [Pseudomonadota bacterium]
MIKWFGAILLAIAMAPLPASAQQPFAAAATVDGVAITNWQVEQRSRFLGLLRAPNADRDSVRDVLVNELVQVRAARIAGIQVTAEELDEGLVEFAGRANLTPEEFIAALQQAGVAPETFRDFVRNGLFWRRLVQQRFGPRARPTEQEIERALNRGESGGGVRLLLSEIALPLTPETQDDVRALANRLSDTVRGQAAFQEAARQFSRSPSARRGGRIDWISLAELAPPIAAQVLTLEPGEVSEPVDLGGFVALFLLRDLDETGATTPQALSVDYAEYLIPGGRSPGALAQAATLRDRVDTCDDLYGVARGQPEEVLRREVRAVEELPADLRQVLATLDANEAATTLATDTVLRFVMLCDRVVEPAEGAFEALGQQLLNQRLVSYADGYLAELRADAVIEYN